jgi:hypothetical protein
MADCFGTNFIGIKGSCNNVLPTSGLYINSLTGVDLCTASMVANEDFQTGVELLQDLEKTAILLTKRHFLSMLDSYYNYSFASSLRTIGRHYDDFEANSYLGERGYEIENTSGDELQEMYVDYVEINSDAAYANVPYRIIDGTTITAGTVNLVSGINRLNLDYTAKNRKVSFVIDISTLTQIPVSSNAGSGLCGQCPGECTGHENTCFISRNIQKLTVESSFSYAGNAAGITMGVQCRCSEDNLICKFKDKLAVAIWYHYGALLMDEVIHSKRANPLVRNQSDSARELYVKWMGGENSITGFNGEALYWKEISRVVKQAKNVIGQIRSECLNCNKTRLITQIP